MKKSNLRLRSNVYLRNPEVRLQNDLDFLRHVRGYAGVRALLGDFGLQPNQQRPDDAEVLRLVQLGKLTQAQQETLKWGVPCAACGGIPCGVNFRGEYDFRCDRPECARRSVPNAGDRTTGHRIQVPSSIVRGYLGSLGEALSWAIAQCNGTPPNISLPPLDVPTIIEINQSAARQYTNEQLAAFLVYGIQHGQVR